MTQPRSTGRLRTTATLALLAGHACLVALVIGPPSSHTNPPSVPLLAGLALASVVVGVAAIWRGSTHAMLASLGLAGAVSLLPAAFPTGPWLVLLIAAPVLLLASVEAFLLEREATRFDDQAPARTDSRAVGSPVQAYLRRLPRGLTWTLVLACLAILAHVAVELTGPPLESSLEARSVFGMLAGAVLVLIPALSLPLVHPRTSGNGPETSAWWVLAPMLVALLVLGAGAPPADAQTGSTDLAVTTLEAPGPTVNATTTVTVALTNNGPSDAGPVVVDVRLDGQALREDGSSSIVFSNVPAGTSANQSMLWRPRTDQAGEHELTAAISARNPPDDPVPENDTLSRPTFVRYTELNLTILPGETTKEAFPNETIGYRLILENRGNLPDTANVTVENTNASWTTWLAGPTRDLPPGEATELLLLTRPPPGADARSSGARLWANGTSRAYEQAREPSDPVAPVETVATPRIDVVTNATGDTYALAWTGPEAQFMDPGSKHRFAFGLENQGTREKVVNLALAGRGGTGAWSFGLDRETIIIRPGETGPVDVAVQAPGEGQPGDHVALELSAEAQHPLDPDPITAGTLLNLSISGPDLAVGSIAPQTRVYQGATVEVAVNVTNVGNLGSEDASLNLSLDPGAQRSRTLATLEIPSLAPGASTTVSTPWMVNTTPGPHTLSAAIARSGPDVKPANDIATASVIVREAKLAVHPPEKLQASAGERVTYSEPPNVFVVENLGNAPETVQIQVTSEHGWLDTTDAFELASGARRRVPVTLTVPSYPGTTQDELTLEARMSGFEGLVVTGTVSTEIQDRRAPEFVELDIPTSAPLDQRFEVSTVVLDDIRVREVRAHIEKPDGTTEARLLERGHQDRWAVELTYDAPGAYAITLTAEDAAKREPHANRTGPHGFNVTVLEPPTIHVPEEAFAAPVASGATIGFNVTSKVPLGIVSLTAHGVTEDLVPPYAIDTSGWPTGTHEARIQASDIFSNTVNRTIQVRIDNRLPRILAFESEQVSQGDGAPRYRFTLRAEHAAVADLVIQRPGAPNQVIPFEGGPATFQLTTEVPPGEIEVRARVQSPTGLSNASDPIPLGSEGGLLDEIPAPGLPAAILVLSLCAAGSHRLSRRQHGR